MGGLSECVLSELLCPGHERGSRTRALLDIARRRQRERPWRNCHAVARQHGCCLLGRRHREFFCVATKRLFRGGAEHPHHHHGLIVHWWKASPNPFRGLHDVLAHLCGFGIRIVPDNTYHPVLTEASAVAPDCIRDPVSTRYQNVACLDRHGAMPVC